jgi:hypothetical protein
MSRYKNAVNVVNRELYLIMLCHAQKIFKRKLEILTELLIFPMYEVLDIILSILPTCVGRCVYPYL